MPGCLSHTVSRVDSIGMICLQQALKKITAAKIKIPSNAEAKMLAGLVEKKHPTIKGIFAFLDGHVMQTERPGDWEMQTANYNGMDGVHAIKCLFIFSARGVVIFSMCNFLGTTNDAGMLYFVSLEDIFSHLDAHLKIVGDSAFANTSRVIRMPRQTEYNTLSPEEEAELRGKAYELS